MKTFIQVLGSCSVDQKIPSFYIHYDSARYLFNCPESTQRLCSEHKIRLPRIKNILLSRTHWDHLSGLPGMILTMADQGATDLKIQGPLYLTRALNSMRSFLQRPTLNVQVEEFNEQNSEYKDELLKIKTIPLSLESHRKSKYDFVEEQELLKTMFSNTSSKRKRSLSAPLSPLEPKDIRLCYICEGPEVQGKFDVKRAQALGVPNGPIRGESVTLEDGSVIEAHQVCFPNRKGHIFMILDIENELYFDQLIKSKEMENLLNDQKAKSRVQVVFHIIKDLALLKTEKYQKLKNSFLDTTRHVLFNEELCLNQIVFTSSTLFQSKMNLFHPKVYSIPQFDPKPLEKDYQHEGFIIGQTMLKIDLEPPPLKIDNSAQVPFLNVKKFQNAFLKENPVLEEELKKFPKNHTFNDIDSVFFMGTGSMLPSKYRNVSGIGISTRNGNILMDTGEGSLGQMYRLFGKEKTKDFLAGLELIFISHMHADHHLGLISFLLERQQLTKKPLHLIGPKYLWTFLNDYASTCSGMQLDDLIFDDAQKLLFQGKDTTINNELLRKLNLESITTSPADHCPESFGISLITREPLPVCNIITGDVKEKKIQIVYSGDTRPCPGLVQNARLAQKELILPISEDPSVHCLLIHEATFEDALQKEAIFRKHSTISEAVSVGQQMRCQELILTHFSQRYPKGIKVQEMNKTFDVGFAFDLMQVPFGGCSLLQQHAQQLHHMFPQSDSDEEEE